MTLPRTSESARTDCRSRPAESRLGPSRPVGRRQHETAPESVQNGDAAGTRDPYPSAYTITSGPCPSSAIIPRWDLNFRMWMDAAGACPDLPCGTACYKITNDADLFDSDA